MADDDASLLKSVQSADASAWEQLIARFEGRLLAFARSRLRNEAAAEDVVQETFIGFLLALPNYDESTPLESFLFAIAAHKLTDALRRAGHRPSLSIATSASSHSTSEPVGRDRKASSMARSQEHRIAEQKVLSECLKGLVQSWLSRGEFERLECVELLFVLGWSNKDVALKLQLSEQTIANHKSYVIGKLKAAATAAKLRSVDWAALNID